MSERRGFAGKQPRFSLHPLYMTRRYKKGEAVTAALGPTCISGNMVKSVRR